MNADTLLGLAIPKSSTTTAKSGMHRVNELKMQWAAVGEVEALGGRAAR